MLSCVLVLREEHAKGVRWLMELAGFTFGESFRLALDPATYPPLARFIAKEPRTIFKRRIQEYQGSAVQFLAVEHRRVPTLVLAELHDISVWSGGKTLGNVILYPEDSDARVARNVFLAMRELFVPVRTFPDPFANCGNPVSIDVPHLRE